MTAATVVFLALPFVVLRGATLRVYLSIEAASWIVALILVRLYHGTEVNPFVAVVGFFVVKVIVFFLFVARGADSDVRWTPGRASIVAALLYALTIPLMIRAPIDGDEPFYLLITESIVRDFDLDLRNQYARPEALAIGRRDLQPQWGDPTGPDGQQYSRHEPFLSLLMVPGYLSGGLYGAVATIAFFGVLLVRSTMRLLEDEGIDDRICRAIVPLVAFGPPILFYATRIWPEVPAAFFFLESVRGLRHRRMQRWLPAIIGLTLLKLRFAIIAVSLLVVAFSSRRSSLRRAAIVAAIAALPALLLWGIVGNWTGVHSWRELQPGAPRAYFAGISGLFIDGAAGFLFQAPFYLAVLVALSRWRSTSPAFRTGFIAAIPYLLLLAPRAEWHGGWAPPLRYVVVFLPIFALGIAAVWNQIRGWIPIMALWSAGVVTFGLSYSWRLFHIANGESVVGEALSTILRSDISRMIPSLIRYNLAVIPALVVLVAVILVVRRFAIPVAVTTGVASLVAALALQAGMRPASTVHFEDAHVHKEGGKLVPEIYTIARFLYQGGWELHTGDHVEFQMQPGPATIRYFTTQNATLELGDRAYFVGPTGKQYGHLRVDVPRQGRVRIRCLDGVVNLDRIDHVR